MNIDKYKGAIADIARVYGLDFVILFGSQATGKTHEKSDIDIGIIGRGKIDRLAIGREMENIFDRTDLEIINLAEVSPTLMYAVLRDGKIMYEKEVNLFLKWRVYASKIWMDTAWMRSLRDRKLKEWSQQYKATTL